MKSYIRIAGVLLGLLAASSAHAQPEKFRVTLDTSGLYDTFVGDYLFDLQLNGTHGSKATITDLQFGGGALVGTPDTIGAVVSPSPSEITLGATDLGDLYNEFTQVFSPGNILQFDLQLDPASSNPGDPFPDSFVFGMIETTGDIHSSSLDDGLNGFEYVTLDLPYGVGSFQPGDFRTYSYQTPGGIYTARVEFAPVSVPEPGMAMWLCLSGVLGGTLLTYRRRRAVS